MKFSLDKQDKYTVIKLDEEKLDTLVAPALKSEFTTLNAEGVKNIILDLSNVKYADSSGLSSILIANRLCGALDGYFILTGLSKSVQKLIDISQLSDVLNIIPTVEEAVEAIFMNELEEDIFDDEEDDNDFDDDFDEVDDFKQDRRFDDDDDDDFSRYGNDFADDFMEPSFDDDDDDF